MEINENSGMTTPNGFVPAGSLPPRDTQPAAPAPRTRKTPDDEFKGPPTAVQFRLPADLVTSLRLLSFQTGRSMSEIAFEAMTSETTIVKAWVSTRRSA